MIEVAVFCILAITESYFLIQRVHVFEKNNSQLRRRMLCWQWALQCLMASVKAYFAENGLNRDIDDKELGLEPTPKILRSEA